MRYPGNATYDAAFQGRQGFAAATSYRDRTTGVVKQIAASRVTVTRELSGDLPDDVSLVGGGVAVKARVEADGAAAGAPHPLRRADRIAAVGADTTVTAGYSGSSIAVFTGRVREFGFDEETRAATFDLIDPSDKLRAPVTIATAGSLRRAPGFGTSGTPDFLRMPTNASAIIVAALHACGVRVTPAPSPAGSCVWSAPLVGGGVAEVGSTYMTDSLGGAGVPGVPNGATWLVPGRFGPMPRTPGIVYVGLPSRRVVLGGTDSAFRVDFWADTTGAAGAEDVRMRLFGNELRVAISAGSVSCRVLKSGGGVVAGPTRSVSVGWHHIAVTVSNFDIVLWVDGASSTVSDSALLLPNGQWFDVTIAPWRVQQASVYAATNAGSLAPPSNASFTAQADVDQALLDLDYIPPIDGRIAWELVREVAAAELGAVGFTEEGRFFFRNRDAINSSDFPVATWSTDLVDNLSGSTSLETVRTRVTAVTERRGFSGLGDDWDGWSDAPEPSAKASGVLTLPVGESTHLIAGTRPWYLTSHLVDVIQQPPQFGAPFASQGIIVCDDSNGNAIYTGNAAITARASMISPTVARLTVRNGADSVKYAVWPQGWATQWGMSPGGVAAWMGGRSLGEGEYPVDTLTVSNPASVAAWGDRVYELQSSVWRQSRSSVQGLAERLLADLAEPRAELSEITVPADLRWEVGDPIRLTDWRGRIPDVLARIVRSEVTIGHEVESGIVGKYALRTLPT